MAAKYIHFTVERIGIGRALSDIKDMTDKIIQFTAGAYQDPSPDVRFWGKKLIILLSQHHGEFTLSTRFPWDADVFDVQDLEGPRSHPCTHRGRLASGLGYQASCRGLPSTQSGILPKFSDFDKLAARHLSQNDVRSILEAAHHLSINGIQKPSSATRSVSGKHKSNSTLDSPKRISRSG